jgi:NDP-sugar pyrophosphorylase family protein
MQAAILAGGLGTRLRPLTEKIPKAMVPINGRPFLEYEIELLRRSGVDELVMCIGYLGGKIEEHFGNGKSFGVTIEYSWDGERLLGPIGALKLAERLLGETFFVTYGDAYLRLDYRRMMDVLLRSGVPAVMAVYRNENRYGKSDVVVRNGFVVEYDKQKAVPGMHWINFGVTAMRREALASVIEGQFGDEEPFYGQLLTRGQLLAFETSERFYEIGSESSVRGFRNFISKMPIPLRSPSA